MPILHLKPLPVVLKVMRVVKVYVENILMTQILLGLVDRESQNLLTEESHYPMMVKNENIEIP